MKADAKSTLDIFVEKGKKIGLEEGRIEGDQQKNRKNRP